MKGDIKIISLNVNGIAEKTKRERIFDYLKTLNADIYCLQETHSATNDDANKWAGEWGGKAVWSHGSHRSRGTAVLFHPKHQIDIDEQNLDNEGRIVALNVKVENKELNIINIYAPNSPALRKTFFQNIWKFATGAENLLLGGDFNCIAKPDIDKCGGDPQSGTAGIVELNTIISMFRLNDIWRTKNPTDKVFTWHNRDFTQRSRIDRWYIDNKLTDSTQAHIRACPVSDHSAVEIQVQLLDSRSAGPGIWKFNTTLLQDKHFEQETRTFLKYWRTEKATYNNIGDWWDDGKERIKKIAVKHSVRRAKAARKNEKALRYKLTTLTSQIQPNLNEIDNVQNELNRVVDNRLQGARIRSRATWAEKGEKSTGFFFSLERKKQPRNTITELTTTTGPKTNDLDILEETKRYYQTLYTDEPTNTDEQNWFLNQLENKLTDATKALCEGPITEAECLKAINTMAPNKAPGPDGLPMEFYRHFWNELKTDITEVLNGNYENGQMTDSQKEALLRLLYKKYDKKLLKNWRPISLLNTDYKIAAKTLATRLKQALPEVINEDQTCGIPERAIFENLFRLRDMTYTATTKNTDLILINIDQEKAFDRINRQFLQKVLTKMNFGPSFKRWIETLYAGAYCRITNNGWRSDPVLLKRGVRQGCPLSPLLYVIAAEALGNAIRRDQHIRGITLPGTPTPSKICQYADDSTLTLKDDTSVLRCFDVLARYEAATGGKLNLEKTEGIYVGSQAGRQHGPVPITWKTDNIEVLGTKMGNDSRQDWTKRLEKTETTLQKWQKRDTTITGRALLVRTYALASLIYLATVFTVPNNIITRLNTVVFAFLWKGKNELVKRATMYLPLDRGGLAIPDLGRANDTLQFKWTQQVTDPKYQRPWVHNARYWIGTALSTIRPEWAFLRSSLKPHADPTTTPLWYKKIRQTAQQHREQLKKDAHRKITAKTLLTLTNDPTATPRAEKIWQQIFNVRDVFRETWNGIWTSLSRNKEKETVWKLTHRVLTTKAYLTRWGMNTGTGCPFCGQTEDTHHALIGCKRAIDLWSEITTLLRPITANVNLNMNLETLVFSKGFPEEKYEKALVMYIVNVTVSGLWQTRNKKILTPSTPPVNLYGKIKGKIRNRITDDFVNRKISNLELIWSIKGILCTYNGDKVIFKI